MPAVDGSQLTGLKQYSEVLLGITVDSTYALNAKILWDVQDPPASFSISSGDITLPAGKIYLLEGNVGCRSGTWSSWYWAGAPAAIYGGVVQAANNNTGGWAAQIVGIVPSSGSPTVVSCTCGGKSTTNPGAYANSTTARIRIYQP